MRKKTALFLFLILHLIFAQSGQCADSPEQADKSTMDAFIDNLMSKMTPEEKIGQLNLPSVGFDVTGPVVSKDVDAKLEKGLVGGVFNTYTPQAVRKLQKAALERTRLKIPLLFGYDVIHGHRTIFPINLGLSCSWNMDLIERTARAAASEASADGLNWTFSPMVDIARDPRWGRVSEGAGEDPYLGSQVAAAMVSGYQGDNLADNNNIMACVKHFALYGAAEAGRDYNTIDMSRLRMYNEYLPPYKAAVDAGVGSVMSSFNEVDGIPASGNKWLMTDLLRKQWGFKGFVVTDYTAINEMIQHGVGDEAKVCDLALNAGIDMDMVGEIFLNYAAREVKASRVSQEQIDSACRRILEAKYKLGLFSDPYRGLSEERARNELMSKDKLELSREAAIKSMVLLKNENKVLPLDPAKKIAFIGPLVKDRRNLIGSWSGAGDWNKSVSLWEALESTYGTAQPADGKKLSGKGRPDSADKDAHSNEGRSQSATGKSQSAVGSSVSRALPKNFLYAKGCNLVDDPVLFERLNKEGAGLVRDKLTPEQLIAEAVKTANRADQVVVVLGEPSSMCGEAASRSDIGLFENQVRLLKALKETKKPIVLVLMNGRPLTLSWEDKNVDAILETWYGGTMAGAAINDVLFGVANPSGKLSMTFPRALGQVPIYYNHKNTGRPFSAEDKYRSKYLDVSNEPLYPFGYGLSYTDFLYGDITLSTKARMPAETKMGSITMTPTETLTVSIPVTNTGSRPGLETVQLYIRDHVGSITRPVKELKAFQQALIMPGERKIVEFELGVEDLKFYDSELRRTAEPGVFSVFIGPNSRDTKEARFTLAASENAGD